MQEHHRWLPESCEPRTRPLRGCRRDDVPVREPVTAPKGRAAAAGGPPAGGAPVGPGMRTGGAPGSRRCRPSTGLAGPGSSDARYRPVSAVLGFGIGSRSRRKPLGFILYFRGDLLEFRLELASVVGAEEQFTAAQQDDAQICLGAATVASVSGRQRGRGCQNSSHVASSLARRAVVPGSTSNQAENVPALGFSSKLPSEAGRLLPVGGEGAVLRRFTVSRCQSFACRSSILPRLSARLFMRTCPNPKWFMPGRERDVSFTPPGDRTSVRICTRLMKPRGWRCIGSTWPRYPSSGTRATPAPHGPEKKIGRAHV